MSVVIYVMVRHGSHFRCIHSSTWSISSSQCNRSAFMHGVLKLEA